MLRILRDFEHGDERVIEYTLDGESISHTVRTPIVRELVEPIEPQPTIEEKLASLERQLQEQQMQNLILVDINLTVYEELLNMKDQLAQLTGATDNA